MRQHARLFLGSREDEAMDLRAVQSRNTSEPCVCGKRSTSSASVKYFDGGEAVPPPGIPEGIGTGDIVVPEGASIFCAASFAVRLLSAPELVHNPEQFLDIDWFRQMFIYPGILCHCDILFKRVG